METLDKLDSLAATLSAAPHHENAQALVLPASRRPSTGVVEAPTLVAMQGLITYAKELVVSVASHYWTHSPTQ